MYEQIKYESDESKDIREAMKNVINFRLAGSITEEQFNEQVYGLKESILKLIEKGDSSVIALAEKFKANFRYHSNGL